MKDREILIKNYISAYNSFDINKMLADMDDSIRFENVSNGEVTMSLVGLTALREQAEKAKEFFSIREQSIISFNHEADHTEISIGYKAILAVDLPNGMKKGDTLQLTGKSIFRFLDGKITHLTDES